MNEYPLGNFYCVFLTHTVYKPLLLECYKGTLRICAMRGPRASNIKGNGAMKIKQENEVNVDGVGITKLRHFLLQQLRQDGG